MNECILRRTEVLLNKLLNFVGVRFHFPSIQQERGLGPWSQVLQDVRLPEFYLDISFFKYGAEDDLQRVKNISSYKQKTL